MTFQDWFEKNENWAMVTVISMKQSHRVVNVLQNNLLSDRTPVFCIRHSIILDERIDHP